MGFKKERDYGDAKPRRTGAPRQPGLARLAVVSGVSAVAGVSGVAVVSAVSVVSLVSAGQKLVDARLYLRVEAGLQLAPFRRVGEDLGGYAPPLRRVGQKLVGDVVGVDSLDAEFV